MNSKMILVDDKFVELDDCFFRIPGIRSLSDVPKTVKLADGVQVDFEKHIATVEDFVFEEEKVSIRLCNGHGRESDQPAGRKRALDKEAKRLGRIGQPGRRR